MHRIRKFMPLFVVAILAAVIILPMWAGNTETSSNAAEIKTLEELKAAFEAGGEYKLAADIVSDTYIEGFKDITLDLNGHKLSRTNIVGREKGDKDRYFINFRDGTFTINNSSDTIGEIYAAEEDGAIASPRVVAANALDPDEAYPNGYHPVVIVNKNVKLKVKGSAIRNVDGYTGVMCLGVLTGYLKSSDQIVSTAQAIVNEGAILDASECLTEDTGKTYTVLVDGYGAGLQINGGTFIAGRRFLNVDDGATATIANGTFTSKNRGIWCAGDLVINGGTFTTPTDKKLLNAGWDLDSTPEAYTKGKIIVNGGTFTGKMSEDKDAYGNYQGYIEIKNGTFYNDPTEFAVGSADVTYSANKWTVKNSTKEISDYNGLLLLEKGGTFKLASNIVIPDDSEKVKLYKDVTLDLNGKEITKKATAEMAKVLFDVRDGEFKVTSDTAGKVVLTVDNDQIKGRVFRIGASTTSVHPKLILDGKIEVSLKGGAEKSDCISAWTEYDDETPLDDPTKVDRTADVTVGSNIVLTSEKGRGILTEGYGVTATINGATINSEQHNATSNDMGAVLTVNGGVFTTPRHCFYNCKATLKVNGGTFKTTSAEKYVLYNDADENQYYKAKADTVMTITGGSFSGAIKNYVEEAQGKATISISNGTFTVDPSAYLATGAVVTEEGGIYTVSKANAPTKPTIDEELQKDIPATVDTTKVADTYTEPAAAVEGTAFKEDDVETVNGDVVMKEAKATEIIEKGLAESEKLKEVSPLPIFTIKVDTASGKIIACTTLKVDGTDLLADTFEKVDVRKLQSDTSSAKFVYTADPKAYADGTFTVLDENGKTATGDIDATKSYQLLLFVADNGVFDADPAIGTVKDPSALVKVEEETKPSSSSSGGCNAGFGAIALLFAVPAIFRKKK